MVVVVAISAVYNRCVGFGKQRNEEILVAKWEEMAPSQIKTIMRIVFFCYVGNSAQRENKWTLINIKTSNTQCLASLSPNHILALMGLQCVLVAKDILRTKIHYVMGFSVLRTTRKYEIEHKVFRSITILTNLATLKGCKQISACSGWPLGRL